jgi:Transcriptional regulator, AbiEi antitoxin
MHGDIDRAIVSHARNSHGVFTPELARLHGMSESAISRRLQSGRWEEPHPGVMVIAGAPPTWEQRLLCAVLSEGVDAAASHRSAGRVWGFEGFGYRVIDVVVPRWDRRRREEVTIHESKDLVPTHVTTRRGIPVTCVERFLVDVGWLVPRTVLQAAVYEAIRKRWTTWPALWEMVDQVRGKGRRGVGKLRQVLGDRPDGRLPDTPWEVEVADHLTRHGFAAPVLQHEVVVDGRRFFLDLAWPDRRAGIELHGAVAHYSLDAFHADPVRRNLLRLAGWNLLEYTWATWSQDRATILHQAQRLLAYCRAAERYGNTQEGG